VGKTKIVLNRQSEVKEDVSFGSKNIKALADPVDGQDAVTKSFLESYVGTEVSTGSGVIGLAEDGSYADGLFTDFSAATPVGTAVDRFNEVLKSLSPQPAPNLSSMSSNSGVGGKLSFGATNAIDGYTNATGVDINGSYAIAGTRLGIFNGSTAVTGTLANNVTPNFVSSRPYPNNAFGDGNVGLLHLEVNGSIVKTIDLSSFTSGASLSASGSGFTLSAATAVQFTNGDSFSVFQYRTGTWTVSANDQVSGYNTVRVRHEYATGLFRTTQTFDFVADRGTTATTFSGEVLNTLAMTGSKYLSGVQYHNAGTAKYSVTILNGYVNTYSASASALSHTTSNCSISAEAIPTATTQADNIVLTNRTATVSATRLLNGSISVNTTVDRTVQSDVTSTGASITGLLYDNVAESSTNTSITFNGEARRINGGVSLTSTSYGSGAAGSQQSPWDSTQSLVGADANHNTGLLVYNGVLQYPKTNFSTIANGPAGNVNYSAAAGLRTFLCYFYDSAAHSNFRLNVAGASIAFVPVSTGPSGNNLTLEVLAPNTTKQGGTVEFKDAMIAYSTDNGIGCYASTYGAVVPTAWGCTLGSKNTSTSGNVIVVKITAAAAWTGSISSISITWL
jgi:hypothetical protein